MELLKNRVDSIEMGDEEEPLVSAAVIAERLGVTAGWVLDQWQAGRIPGYRLGDTRGPVRFSWREIERWLAGRRRGPLVVEGRSA